MTPGGTGWPAIPGATSGGLISVGGGGGGNLEIPGGNTSVGILGTMGGPGNEGCCLIGGGGGGIILGRSFGSAVLASDSEGIPSNRLLPGFGGNPTGGGGGGGGSIAVASNGPLEF